MPFAADASTEQRATRALGRSMLALQALGAAAVLAAWGLEWHAGVIGVWDRWLLPLCAAIVLGATVAAFLRPAWESALRVLPLGCFNLYLVVTFHAALYAASGDQQRYEMMSDLYWVPLGYGCAFVFLRLRAALVVSGLTASGIFAPLLWMAWTDRLPPWTVTPGPLLQQVAFAHLVFVALLTAVVRLRSSHERAQAHVELMRHLAATDVLTGLPNRRAMIERLERALALSARTGQPLSVALIDVDRFKSINDRFGHPAGDEVLQRLGGIMRTQLRASDEVGRWGGEEFLLFAPGSPMPAARELAERVRQAIAEHPFDHGEPVTVSVGLAGCEPHDRLELLLHRADEALYRAKAGGRNRIEAASPAHAGGVPAG
jgi:diguanylate cyclase (GGDEF)-like protein